MGESHFGPGSRRGASDPVLIRFVVDIDQRTVFVLRPCSAHESVLQAEKLFLKERERNVKETRDPSRSIGRLQTGPMRSDQIVMPVKDQHVNQIEAISTISFSLFLAGSPPISPPISSSAKPPCSRSKTATSSSSREILPRLDAVFGLSPVLILRVFNGKVPAALPSPCRPYLWYSN
jgi:hypothetical protein